MSRPGGPLGRQERLLATLAERGLDAMMVSDLSNVRYLTGYVGSNGVAVISPGGRYLFTDSRYVVAARAMTRGVEVVQAGRDLLERVAEALGDTAAGGRVAIEADNVVISRHERLKAALEGLELVPESALVEDLRVVKDAEEVDAIRRAAAVADAAFAGLASGALSGRAERDVAWDLEGALRAGGAEGPSFPIIVAAAANGARPHAVPGPQTIPPGTLVVVDMGAVVDGYSSDCTRTFATGPLPDELSRAYEVCREAQATALAACKPGICAKDLDAVAREAIVAAGFGEAFGHGLGHGVGLDIHERPWVRPEGTEELAAGMVVTIEPGIYLEGSGGVRIEDQVVVTEGGCEILTGFTKELVTL